jgi:hypothetical protein
MEVTKDIVKPTTPFNKAKAARTVSPDERMAAGKALRDKNPREQHGRWNNVKGRIDKDLEQRFNTGRRAAS